MRRHAGINLLPSAGDAVVRERTVAKVLSLTTVVAFVSVLVGIGSLWSATLVGRAALRREEERIRVLQERIGTSSTVEQQYHLVSDRLSAAESVVAARPPLEQLMERLTDVLPPEASLISAKFSELSSSVDIRVSFPTFAGLRELMARIQSGSAARVIVVQEYRMQDGTIQFDLRLSLK